VCQRNGRPWHVSTTSAGCRKFVGTPPSLVPFQFRLLAHLKSWCPLSWLTSVALLPLKLPPVTHFLSSLLSLGAQLSTNFICCLALRSNSSHFLSTSVYRAAKVLFQCFLVALSLLSFCPWHRLSSLRSYLRFRILDISIMREALVRLGGLQTRLDSGRR